MILKICKFCGKPFHAERVQTRYCENCKYEAKLAKIREYYSKRRKKRYCVICGRELQSRQLKYCENCRGEVCYTYKDTGKQLRVPSCNPPGDCFKCPHPDCIRSGAITEEESEIAHSWHNKSEHTFPTVDDIKYKRARCLV